MQTATDSIPDRGTKTPHAQDVAKNKNKKTLFLKWEIISTSNTPFPLHQLIFSLIIHSCRPLQLLTLLYSSAPSADWGGCSTLKWWDYSDLRCRSKVKMAITKGRENMALRLAELKPWSMIGKTACSKCNWFSLDKWQLDTLLLPHLYWGISDKKCTCLSCIHWNHCLN